MGQCEELSSQHTLIVERHPLQSYTSVPTSTISALSLHIQKAERAFFPVTAFVAEGPITKQALPSAEEHPLFYVAGYAIIGLLAIVLELFASIILVLGTYRASRILFGQLLRSVVGAQMRWHDTNPTGELKYLGTMDVY